MWVGSTWLVWGCTSNARLAQEELKSLDSVGLVRFEPAVMQLEVIHLHWCVASTVENTVWVSLLSWCLLCAAHSACALGLSHTPGQSSSSVEVDSEQRSCAAAGAATGHPASLAPGHLASGRRSLHSQVALAACSRWHSGILLPSCDC